MKLNNSLPRYITRVKTHNLLQVCKQVVTSLFTSCQQVVFALLVPSLLQVCCNNFGTSRQQLVTTLMALSDLLQGCTNKSDTVTTKQDCHKVGNTSLHQYCHIMIVTDLLQLPCKSLIISKNLLRVVNNLQGRR